ncbi:MAG: glutaredoxin [Gammaproteobacteria bacterium HGW-Gammaproteobacteria-6]|nr:MAG: glutaredoxin [Gammaproteobacteria bacterium HGW-Gammaproteobacteria-6]
MTPLPTLTLYGTLACHLCDNALAALEPLIADGLRVEQVDISDDDVLMSLYQLRIPVLKRSDTGSELDFPFDLQAVMVWLDDVLREGC